MKGDINIKLSLLPVEANSQLKATIYENELEEINCRFPINKNEFDVKKIYIIKNNDILETEFFIRNSLDKEISLENISLAIKDIDGNIIESKKVNFKEYGIIPPFSARPYRVDFETNRDINFDENKEYFIEFNNNDELSGFYSIETEIENIPIDMNFEEEKAIRDFANTLKTLKVGEFSVSCYNIRYNKFSGIDCTLLLRNGTNITANVDNLPISLIDENDQLIVRKVFRNERDILTVSFKKSKIITLQFKADELLSGEVDLTKCKVIFN